MKELKRRFNRFCFRNRDKGIPNLMLYITIGAAALALMNMVDPSGALYYMLCFDREMILQGQVWRLITYPLCYADGIGNGICHLVGVAVGNTFGSKQSLLHNQLSFLNIHEKNAPGDSERSRTLT